MSVKKIGKIFFFIIPVSTLLLSGCGQDRKAEKDVSQFVQRAEQVAKAKKYQLEKKEKPIVSYVYEGDNLRDPFDRTESVINMKRYEDAILTSVSIDNLQLVGTVLRSQNSWAIVRGPDKKIYRLMLGMHVGMQQAKLSEIKQDEIIFKTESELGSAEKSNDIVIKIQE